MRRSPKTNSSVQRRGFPSSGTQLFGWALALRGVSPSTFRTAAPNPCDPAWSVRLSLPEGSFLPTLLPFPSFLPSSSSFAQCEVLLGTYALFRTRLPSRAYDSLPAKSTSPAYPAWIAHGFEPGFPKAPSNPRTASVAAVPLPGALLFLRTPPRGAFISSFSSFSSSFSARRADGYQVSPPRVGAGHSLTGRPRFTRRVD